MRRSALPFVIAAALTGCGPVMTEEVAPKLVNPLFEPATLTDMSDDPRVVEVHLVATEAMVEILPGKPVLALVYQDGEAPGPPRIPGPMLVAHRGDSVIVHFENRLSTDTTVHWHGLRLPAQFDGSTSVQNPILPGATFEYRFVAQDAGTFWYHPHVRAEIQIERGLQAPFIVLGDEAIPDVAADRTLILDDVKLEADGHFSEVTDELDIMLGRQGNLVTVNGQLRPEIAFASGGRERWRIINSANGRYFNLRIPGHQLQVIGWDGGLLAEPYFSDTLLVAPAERYEVLVSVEGAIGDRIALETIHYDRGHEIPEAAPKALFDLVVGPPARTPEPLATLGPPMAHLPTEGATVRRFVLREQRGPNGDQFLINDQLWPFNTPVMVEQGEVEIWEVVNDSEMDHPFHLHGMFFEPLDVDGTPPAHVGLKDTFNIPQKKTLRFAVRYDAIGMWMFHCHILEHAERGMMGDLMVMAAE